MNQERIFISDIKVIIPKKHTSSAYETLSHEIKYTGQ